MAEENDTSQKTEDPTQRRLEEARKKGDIAKSQDVPVWFLLLASAAIMAGAGPLAQSIAAPLVKLLDHPQAFHLADGGALKLLYELLMSLFVPLAIIFGVIAAAVAGGHLLQHRPLWTLEKIKPDLSKLSPGKGFARMFGAHGWVNLLKSALKIGAICAAMLYAVWPDSTAILGAGRLAPGALMGITQSIAARLLIAAIVVVG